MSALHVTKKTETGAELLARLRTRPNPRRIDPFIFADSLSSSAPSSASSPCGQLVEIFGPEGAGKSEFALHCAAKAFLPVMSKGIELKGLGGKVVFIDTDNKFSILRLAVILEKQIQHALSARRNTNSTTLVEAKVRENDIGSDPVCSDDNDNGYRNKNNNSGCNISSSADEERQDFDSVNKCSKKDSSVILPKKQMVGRENTIRRKEFQVDKKETTTSTTPDENCEELTDLDIEEIIKDSLKRFFVMKVNNSQQLLASLLTLEDYVAGDHLYTLLIIDSISAYYWMDKASNNTHSVEHNMAPISASVSRLVDNCGLTCLAVSSALFAGKKKHFGTVGVGGGAVNDESGKNMWMNSDYLGKSWIATRRKRISLEKREVVDERLMSADGRDNVTIHAFCSLTKTKKSYEFQDDFLKVKVK